MGGDEVGVDQAPARGTSGRGPRAWLFPDDPAFDDGIPGGMADLHGPSRTFWSWYEGAS